MSDRFKFECVCGQRLVARRRMAGVKIHCPACVREITVPAAGEALEESHYANTERYAVTCPCGYRMLVKAEAAGQTVRCPVCTAALRVPALDILRRETARGLEPTLEARQRVHTEDLLLLIDDEEGPGTDVR